MRPRFFRTPAAFRTWLHAHHGATRELWVGFYKKDSGRPSLSWPESVDEALCVGWIDGIRKRIDDASYMIRFTPRRSGSIWSAVNIARARALIAEGRMLPAGLEAFEARTENKSGGYSYEQRPVDLPDPYATLLKRSPAAWHFLKGQAPSYRRAVTWWIVSAKKDETRMRRLETLTARSAQGLRLRDFTPQR